jgi:hypothetical protein
MFLAGVVRRTEEAEPICPATFFLAVEDGDYDSVLIDDAVIDVESAGNRLLYELDCSVTQA